jgi:hypothetical protein
MAENEILRKDQGLSDYGNINGKNEGPTLSDIRQVVSRYRRKQAAPVLFGTKRGA